MVWYDPRSWRKKKPEPKPQEIFFGEPPKTPFAPPGTYVTPKGKISYGGGEAIRRGGGGAPSVTGAYVSPETGEVITEPTPIPSVPPLVPPSARTISQQMAEKEPTTISAYTGEFIPYEQSWWESTKQAVAGIPTGAVGILKGYFTEQDVSRGVEHIFDPYKYSGKLKEEKTAFAGIDISVPWRGTEITEGAFDPYKTTAGLTYSEVAERGYPISGLKTRTGVIAPTVAETGGLIAASATVAGATVVSGYLMGRGMKETVTAPTMGGKALGLATMGVGLYGVGMVTGTIAKQVDIATLESLEAQKLRISGQELIKGEKGTLYLIKGGKSVGTAELKTTMKMPVFKTGKDVYSITGGKGVSRIKYFSFAKEKWITAKETFEFFGKGYVSPSAKVSAEGIIKPLKGWEATWGKGGIIRGEEITGFGFGGVTKDVGKYYAIAGGKIKAGRYYPLTGARKGVLDISQYGFIKKLPEKGTMRIWTGTGKKSSEQYFRQLYSTGAIPSITEQTTKQFISGVTPTVSKGGAFIGLGAITKQTITTPTKIKTFLKVPPITLEKGKEKRLIITTPSLKLETKPLIRTVSFPRLIETTITKPTTKVLTAPTLTTKQLQKPLQKTRLTTMFPPSPLIKTTIPPLKYPSIPLLFPLLPSLRLGGRRKKKKGVRPTRPTKYISTIAAMAFKFEAPKIPATYGMGMAGPLGGRPIIKRRKAKMAKRKKRRKKRR